MFTLKLKKILIPPQVGLLTFAGMAQLFLNPTRRERMGMLKQRIIKALVVFALIALAAGFAGSAQAAEDAGAVNINSATVKELTQLNGIGPVCAERIVAYRKANGEFESIEEIVQVKGIGPKTLADFAEQITLKTQETD
ncbi:MAG: helix-hairpin-helix domain-containing protein [Desulfosalsimonadaceae bacterium]